MGAGRNKISEYTYTELNTILFCWKILGKKIGINELCGGCDCKDAQIIVGGCARIKSGWGCTPIKKGSAPLSIAINKTTSFAVQFH